MKASKISELKKELNKSDTLREKFIENPIEFIGAIDTKEPMKDKIVFLFIVSIVGLVLLFSIIIGASIIFKSPDIATAKVPEFIVSIGSTALGAIVGLLAPSPKN